jgi:glycosyltransferase involved in cell wall biosynthesis
MRLGLVGPLPPPGGGMANQTRQLAALLGAQGIAVRLVRTNEPYRPAWIRHMRGVREPFRLASYLRNLAATCREVDVLHVMANSGWSWHLIAAPAILAGAMRDVPVIVNYRGGLAREFLARRAAIVRATMRRARAVVVPSQFLQGVFAEHDVCAEIIPNIVNLEIFRPAATVPHSGIHIVVARNLERIYGIDVAIRAAALLTNDFSELRLSIAGEGSERAGLERLTDQLRLRSVIHFTGALDVPAVAALYASAHVVLNPSRADNTPNSLLEAAASGVPIVSTDVGGIPDLVEHERTAWLVPAENPQAMADGIKRVLNDSALRERLRTNGLALAQSCSWNAVRPQWLGLYERVVEQ